MDGPIILEKHRGSLINELLAALLGYTGGDAGRIVFTRLFCCLRIILDTS